MVSETLAIGTVIDRTGAVRVRVETTSHPQVVTAEAVDRRADVQRIAIGRVVDSVREPWHDGETLVVPVYAERLVLRRELVLTEELHVRMNTVTRQECLEAQVSEQRPVFERQNADGEWVAFEVPPPGESQAPPPVENLANAPATGIPPAGAIPAGTRPHSTFS